MITVTSKANNCQIRYICNDACQRRKVDARKSGCEIVDKDVMCRKKKVE